MNLTAVENKLKELQDVADKIEVAGFSKSPALHKIRAAIIVFESHVTQCRRAISLDNIEAIKRELGDYEIQPPVA
jgi:hypothetical protein